MGGSGGGGGRINELPQYSSTISKKAKTAGCESLNNASCSAVLIMLLHGAEEKYPFISMCMCSRITRLAVTESVVVRADDGFCLITWRF